MLSTLSHSKNSVTEPIRPLAAGLPTSATAVIFLELATAVLESPIDDVHELKRLYSHLIIRIDRIRPSLARIHPDARVADLNWTLTDVFGHLIDTDRDIWWPRIDAILVEDRPTFVDVDPDLLLGQHLWSALPLDDVLAQLMRVRWSNSMRLNTLPSAAFERTGLHPQHGEISLSQILAILVAHDAHYLSLVRSLTEAATKGYA